MKTYPIREKGSFGYGLLGFLAVPFAGGAIAQLLVSASGRSVLSGPYPVWHVTAGHAIGAAAAYWGRDKFAGGMQSFMKWGAIHEVVATVMAPIAGAAIDSSRPKTTEKMTFLPASSSAPGLDLLRKFYGLG